MTKEELHNADVWTKLKVYIHYCIIQSTLKRGTKGFENIYIMSFEEFFSPLSFNPNHDTAWEHYWRFEEDIII
jgi:hypothetical protein